jgi:Fic family protein
MKQPRVVIYPKDIQLITGKSERYGRLLLKKIRRANQKQEHQFITINEFSSFTGIPEATVEAYIR